MPITVIKDTQAKEERHIGYPWLGAACEGTVVLFLEECTGAVIVSGDWNYRVGEYSRGWDMTEFKPIPEGEKLVLQNNWEK